MKMTGEEFNKLVNGPLSHQIVMFRLTRLSLALLHVVTTCGEPAERALREYCAQREAADRRPDEEDPG